MSERSRKHTNWLRAMFQWNGKSRNSFTYGANYMNFITWLNTKCLMRVCSTSKRSSDKFIHDRPSTCCVFSIHATRFITVTVQPFLFTRIRHCGNIYFFYFFFIVFRFKFVRSHRSTDNGNEKHLIVWKRHHLEFMHFTHRSFTVNTSE